MNKIILIGKAAAGKDHMRKVLEGRGFTYGTSYTTRPPREGEIDGQDYYFISEKDFKNKVNELKSEINNYNQNRNKMLTDFNKLKIDNTNNLLKLINPILVKFSNDKEIAIILKKKDLVVAKTQLDITDEVIKIVNSEVKEFKINE